MITSLSFSAIKGRSGSYTFTPVTAILGQNAAGKTAILDAMDWLTIGYVPRRSLGKTNADLFKLASGPAMQAEMVAYGQRVWRRLERRGRPRNLNRKLISARHRRRLPLGCLRQTAKSISS